MRQIKSTQALKSFEAAARHMSFKRAAEEMFVTATAISHQIKTLEQQLNCSLFERQTRQVQLTQQGQLLFSTLRKAFDDIDDTVRQVESFSQRDVVTLGLGPIIGTRWLAPRLGNFWVKHPTIDLRLHQTSFPMHQSLEHFDLAIAWGTGYWPDMEAEPFIDIEFTPVLSPDLKQPQNEAELLRLPLIHQKDRKAWRQWCSAAGMDQDVQIEGTVIDDANLVLQAALSGQGVALGVLPFVEADIAEGRLVRPFEFSIKPEESYYLIYRNAVLKKKAVKSVRDWLVGEVLD
ncbi:MAG: transcriptional regulator GcvA [Thiotrichales bacterium]|nr:MAG: transcriptional regulator GcvA [Thiotrichales bacterium]